MGSPWAAFLRKRVPQSATYRRGLAVLKAKPSGSPPAPMSLRASSSLESKTASLSAIVAATTTVLSTVSYYVLTSHMIGGYRLFDPKNSGKVP